MIAWRWSISQTPLCDRMMLCLPLPLPPTPLSPLPPPVSFLSVSREYSLAQLTLARFIIVLAKVLSVVVCIRPGRKEGVRLERETVQLVRCLSIDLSI